MYRHKNPISLSIYTSVDILGYFNSVEFLYGGIFRDYQATFLGCFASNIGISKTLNAEIMDVTLVIELT